MKNYSALLLTSSLLFAAVAPAIAQKSDIPAPPNILVVQREMLKPGKSGSPHRKTESAFIKAFADAKMKTYYLGVDSLSGPSRALFFVGYADPDSPAGRLRRTAAGELVHLSPDVPPQPLTCEVEQFDFSAHATRESLRTYVNKLRPRKVILVHGDAPAIEWFRAALSADLPASKILLPAPGVPLEL